MNRYRIWDGDVLVCEGARNYVCMKIHRAKTTNLNDYANLKRKICGKYDVEIVLEDDEETRREKEIIENQIFHLRHKELTVALPDVERNIKILEKHGIKARKLEREDIGDKRKKRKPKKYYLLEAVDGL